MLVFLGGSTGSSRDNKRIGFGEHYSGKISFANLLIRGPRLSCYVVVNRLALPAPKVIEMSDRKKQPGIKSKLKRTRNPSPMTPLRRVKRMVIGLVGGTVILIGVALLVLPGPAFVVIPAGLAILAVEFAWARRWLHKARQWFSTRKAPPGASSTLMQEKKEAVPAKDRF